GEWDQLEQLENPAAALKDQDRNTDRPGRGYDSFGGGRHTISPEESVRERELLGFANEIAQYLSKAHAAGRFKRLVLVAEPTILGFVRRKLPAPLKRTLSFEIPKNPADFDV